MVRFPVTYCLHLVDDRFLFHQRGFYFFDSDARLSNRMIYMRVITGVILKNIDFFRILMQSKPNYSNN